MWKQNRQGLLIFKDSARLVKVQNAPDTSDLGPMPEGGWLAWWKETQGFEDTGKFACVFCGDEADRGGHVWNGKNVPLYIVPLCASCNSDDNHDTYGVPEEALVEETCSDQGLWRIQHCT